MVTTVVTADKAEQPTFARWQAVHEGSVFAEPDDTAGKFAAPFLRNEEMRQGAGIGRGRHRRRQSIVAS